MKTPRFEVRQLIKFGLLMGYYIWDNKEQKALPYDFDEDEEDRANTKCELVNLLKAD